MDEKRFMEIALKLAKRGMGYVSPNPMVGAVIVKEGKIIGKGYHKMYGFPHAEIEALNDAKESVKGSTMFVTLEPCSHYGKTPPCAPEIVKAGIKKVFIAMIDPNPIVNGKGIEHLKRNGVEVEVGLCSEKAEELNKFYIHYIKNKTPYVILKMASTLDGFIGDEKRGIKRISSENSLRLLHRYRYEVDGIIVGIDTIIKDNPKLNVRYYKKKRNIKKIVLDYYLRFPEDANLLKTEGETIIFTKENKRKIENAKVIEADGEDGILDLKDILKRIGELGISSVMVEGGKKVFSSFLEDNLFNEVRIFISPRFIGEGIRITEGEFERWIKIKNVKKLGEDFLIIGENVHRNS
jgi:diaminohydroxyphosphoribosylaminopyrimidine deaminase/5-amino-6-(5-phosphoribosylamino)uracil reductase